MAVAFVQSAKNSSTSGSKGIQTLTKAFTSPNVAGNLIVVIVGVWGSPGSVSISTPTDTVGNAYQLAVSTVGAGNPESGLAIFYAQNIGAGANTVSAQADCNDVDLIIAEYSGLETTGALDQVNSHVLFNVTSISTNSVTTTVTDELLVSAGYDMFSAHAWTAGAGWTIRETTANPDAETATEADKIVSSAGTYSDTLSFTGTPSSRLHAAIASFKAAGALPPPPPVPSYKFIPPGDCSGPGGTNPTASDSGPWSYGGNLYGLFFNSYSWDVPPSSYGLNVYKSTDSGVTWSILASLGDSTTQKSGRSVVRRGSVLYILVESSPLGSTWIDHYVAMFDMATELLSFSAVGPTQTGLGGTTGQCPGTPAKVLAVRNSGDVLLFWPDHAPTITNPPVTYSRTSMGLTISYVVPETTVGDGFSVPATHSGGVSPVHFTLTSGSLPPGVSGPDTSTGLIGGHPTAAGTYSPTIRMTDNTGSFVEVTITIIVHPVNTGFWSTYCSTLSGGVWVDPVLVKSDATKSHYPLAALTMLDDRIHLFLGSSTLLTPYPPPPFPPYGFHHVTLDAANGLHTYQDLYADGPSPYGDVGRPVFSGTTISINIYSTTLTVNHASNVLFTATDADDPTWANEVLPFPGDLNDGWTDSGINSDGGWTSCLAISDGSTPLNVFYQTHNDALLFVPDHNRAYFTQVTAPAGLVVLAGTTTTGLYPNDSSVLWWGTKASGSWVWTAFGTTETGTQYLHNSPSAPLVQGLLWSGNLSAAATILATFVPIHLSCNNPPAGTVGVPYDHNLVVTGGTEPYTFTLVSGSLPPGLVLNASTGEITGTPTTAGTYPFTVRVVDSLGNMGQVTCSITIGQGGGGGTLSIRCNLPQVGCIGEFYFHSFAISGGNPPYSVQLISGELPAGLSFDPATGIISGIPTENKLAVFGLRVTDAQGNTATCVCSIVTTCC